MKVIVIIGIMALFLGCATPSQGQSGKLSGGEIEALDKAIQDEYKARATYKGVIEKFGSVKPFSNILQAEEQHISALAGLYDKYGMEVPKDEWKNKTIEYDTLEDACQAGVQAEIENAALYDELMESTDKQDILAVFQNLQKASRDNHLPAFQKCS
jgi:hypothetical protein